MYRSFINCAFLVFSSSAIANIGGIPIYRGFKECPQFRKVDLSPSLESAYARGLKIKNLCKRAEVLVSVSNHLEDSNVPSDKKLHEEVTRNLVFTLFKAQDTVATINEANKYLDKYSQKAYGAAVHYYLLMAQNMRIVDPDKNTTAAEIALGLHDDQSEYNEVENILSLSNGIEIRLQSTQVKNENFDIYKYRRSFQSFINNYGKYDTKYEAHLRQLIDDASLDIQRNNLEIGKYYYKKSEYMAAIGRLKSITQSGPVVSAVDNRKNYQAWDEAAFYTALSFFELAESLMGKQPRVFYNSELRQSMDSILWILPMRSYKIENRRVAHWLRIDPEKYNPGQNKNQPSRTELAEVSIDNIGLIVSEMKTTRSNSPVTKNLIQELQEKITPAMKRLVPDIEARLQL